jgi:hypothetical protein
MLHAKRLSEAFADFLAQFGDLFAQFGQTAL